MTKSGQPSPTRISLVVAAAENGAIGASGGLPWKLKADLMRFRAVTMGKPMIMGRSTFESIGRALDGRDSIVLTRNPAFTAAGAMIAADSPSALALAEVRARSRGVDEICVIGGAAVFGTMRAAADRIHMTHVHCAPEGDVFFAPLQAGDWVAVHSEDLPASAGDTAAGTYVIYDRR